MDDDDDSSTVTVNKSILAQLTNMMQLLTGHQPSAPTAPDIPPIPNSVVGAPQNTIPAYAQQPAPNQFHRASDPLAPFSANTSIIKPPLIAPTSHPPPPPPPPSELDPNRPDTNIGILSHGRYLTEPPKVTSQRPTRLAKSLRESREADPIAHQALIDEIEKEASTALDVMHPAMKRKRLNIATTWGEILFDKDPNLDPSAYFHTDTVRTYARYYLGRRVAITSGNGGRTHVMASTLAGWLLHLTWVIVAWCHEPGTLLKTGIELLLTEGLYKQMEELVFHLTKKYSLVKTRKQYFLRRQDILLLIETKLEATTTEGRLVAIQEICGYTFSFYTGARPGSLAAMEAYFRDQGHYLKFKHVSIQRVHDPNDPHSSALFDVVVELVNWKGYVHNTAGMTRTYRFNHVTKAHNVLLSPMWIVLNMYLRGAFKYQTLNQLLEDDEDPVVLDEKLEEPFFLAGNEGGRTLKLDPPVAALSSYLTKSIQNTALKAGLPPVSFRAIRRGSGDTFGVELGKEVAKMLLGHGASRDTYSTFYSWNTANLPVVGIMLGEIVGDAPGEAMRAVTREMHDRTCLTFQVLVKHSKMKNAWLAAVKQEYEAKEWTQEDLQVFEEKKQSVAVAKLQLALDDAYLKWSATLSPDADVTKLDQVVEIINLQPGNGDRGWHKRLVSLLEALNGGNQVQDVYDPERAASEEQMRTELILALANLRERHKKWRRAQLVKRTKADNLAPLPAHINTAKVRHEVSKIINQPSSFLAEIARTARADLPDDAEDTEDHSAPLTTSDPDTPIINSDAISRYERGAKVSSSSFDDDDGHNPDDDLMIENGPAVQIGRLRSMITKTRLDLQEPPLPPRQEDEEEIDVPEYSDATEQDVFHNVPASLLTKIAMATIIGPHLDQLSLDKAFRDKKGVEGEEGVECPLCIPFREFSRLNPGPYVGLDVPFELRWSNRTKYKRHMMGYHTPWKQLELRWFNKEKLTFSCFKCGKSVGLPDSLDNLRKHCSSRCAHKEWYRRVKDSAKEQEEAADAFDPPHTPNNVTQNMSLTVKDILTQAGLSDVPEDALERQILEAWTFHHNNRDNLPDPLPPLETQNDEPFVVEYTQEERDGNPDYYRIIEESEYFRTKLVN